MGRCLGDRRRGAVIGGVVVEDGAEGEGEDE